jgi:hypothetical protein
MPNNTGRLMLPYILQSQSQKEVTHNDALNILDVVIQAVVQDVGLNTPPGSPTVGQCWVVGSSPTGAWAGKASQIAQAVDGGGWFFVAPFKRLKLWNETTDEYVMFDGTNWVSEGLLIKETGEYLRVEHKTEDVTVNTGAFKDTTIQIPDRAIVLAVNVRVMTAITGATSFGIGVAGDTTRYGNLIGTALDSTNIGITSPLAYYANTAIRLTANGGNFTGGVIRTTMQYLKPRGPWTW